jgi:hypothetical protein
MKYYLVPIIIFLLGFLFLYTFFDKILREMDVPRGVEGLRLFYSSGRGVAHDNPMGADGGHPRIENFSSDDITGESICSLYSSKPSELNSKCNSLTETNCNATSCCGWLNGSSCVAGDALGPTFRTKNGKNIDIKSYSTGGITR